MILVDLIAIFGVYPHQWRGILSSARNIRLLAVFVPVSQLCKAVQRAQGHRAAPIGAQKT